MGLMNFLRGELIDIIEWNQESASDVMAWRFPRKDNEIKNGAKLVVREGQKAVLVDRGLIADVFNPGMHTLDTKNIPLLSKLMGWKHGFESPFKCEVYFVSTRRFTDLKWGTSNPIMMRDREFGMVRLRAYGSYAVQVGDATNFLRELISTDPQFETFEIAAQMRNMIVTRFTDAVASSGIPCLDMAGNLDELSDFCRKKLGGEFGEMGLTTPIFLVENISLPPNVEEALDKRTSMGLVGNLDQYMKFQAATALEKAASNPADGGAGMGAGLGVGMGMAQQMMGSMNQASQPGMASGGPPPLPTAVQWFAGIGGQQAGPYAPEHLGAEIAAGRVTPDTVVWRQGMANWTKASEVPEVAAMFGAGPPPLPPTP